ncbi:hypothetical protein AVEN_155681-1 [Araneus ventricosus]|uniref:Uncharacterized protein n=1 Tax=Araneus ventricosus TaxID=182803 RepID=A0A4Y2LUS4_ARAVE|nr:hypothetical protein AVEN_12085-1 [Araneus ventricosus]GBN18576.1 hypothetical protein AVEN_155681-1 [Araneus ventricosus]
MCHTTRPISVYWCQRNLPPESRTNGSCWEQDRDNKRDDQTPYSNLETTAAVAVCTAPFVRASVVVEQHNANMKYPMPPSSVPPPEKIPVWAAFPYANICRWLSHIGGRFL